jgi:hypothetical protein
LKGESPAYIPVEVSAFGFGHDELLPGSGWDAEIAVDGSASELESEHLGGTVVSNGGERCRFN